MELWKAGPVEVASGQAQKALYLLKENPMLFDSAVEEALEALAEARDAEEGGESAADGEAAKDDMALLRRRMDEVRSSDRMRTVMELLYLKVCARFRQLEAPLLPPLKEGGYVSAGQVDLKKLTSEIYSKEALELVREHLFQFMGQANAPFGAQIMMPLFQAGQVYAMSAIFGYYLRQVDARFQLEKLAGSFGAWGDEDPPKQFDGDEESTKSLKDYVAGFNEDEIKRMTNIASSEARMAMEAQTAALFGDLRALKEKLVEVVGMVFDEQEANEKVTQAMQSGDIKALRLTSQDLQRLVLEAVAFGSLLSDAEKQVDAVYELTPSNTRNLIGKLMGDDDLGRMLPE
jgi:hypothetical protein